MTHRRIRKFLAALCVLAAVAGMTTPAYAATSRSMASMIAGTDPVPPMVDVLILRPAGIVALVGGFSLFVLSSPIMLVTRPKEMAKPFDILVRRPAKYIWHDPIGQH